MDRAHTSAGARVKALHHEIFANIGFGDDQLIDVETVIVLRVRYRGLKSLLHVLRDPLVRKGELRQSLFHLLAADQLSDEVKFLRADTKRASYRLSLVVLEPPLGFRF